MRHSWTAALAALLAFPAAAEPTVTVTIGAGSIGCTTQAGAETFATMRVGEPMPAGCTRLPPLTDIPVTRVATVDGLGAGNAPKRWDIVFWRLTDGEGCISRSPAISTHGPRNAA